MNNNLHLTTFIHNGIVYTIGSEPTYNLMWSREEFAAEVSIANGRGISYPRGLNASGETENAAVAAAITNILTSDPITCVAITSDGTDDSRPFTSYVRDMDTALAMIGDADMDLTLAIIGA